jgi:hypothetical protein
VRVFILIYKYHRMGHAQFSVVTSNGGGFLRRESFGSECISPATLFGGRFFYDDLGPYTSLLLIAIQRLRDGE